MEFTRVFWLRRDDDEFQVHVDGDCALVEPYLETFRSERGGI